MAQSPIQKQAIKNILAISTTGLGNLILYTPALKALRRNFPDARITLLVGNKAAVDLLKDDKNVDEIIRYDRKVYSLRILGRLIRRLRQRRFDLFITSFLDRSFKVAVFGWLTGARYRIGFAHPWYDWLYTHKVFVNEQKHEIEYNLDLLRTLSIPVRREKEKKPGLSFSALAEELVSDFLVKNDVSRQHVLVGIHPGSGLAAGEAKRWPQEKFAYLGDLLLTLPRVKVLIFGGPEEKRLVDNIVRSMYRKPIVVAGVVDIKTAAGLIKRCRLFVSNDSGLMHLATAVQTPVLAIFGPTLWWKNYPWGAGNVVIRRQLKCAPCYQYRPITCTNRRCLEDISAEEVFGKAQELLAVPKRKFCA